MVSLTPEEFGGVHEAMLVVAAYRIVMGTPSLRGSGG